MSRSRVLPAKKGVFASLFFALLFFVDMSDVPGLVLLSVSEAADRDASMIEIIKHEYLIDETWEKIGKTKYIWKVTFQNHSDKRKRVFAYYYLLDDEDVPLARNVANRYVGPHQTVEIVADSYIMTNKVSRVAKSRVKLKVGFPN